MAFPDTPIDLTVELLLDAWTDISTYVRGEQGVEIHRGRSGSSDQLDPQTCTLTLDNRDGRFSPRNPDGAYYGLLGHNTQIRVTVTDNAVDYPRFHGEVAEWPVEWEHSGNDAWASIRADGPLRRLGQSDDKADSILTRSVPGIFGDDLLAYWPMEDEPGSDSLASRGPRARPMRKEGGGRLYDDTTVFKAAEATVTARSGEYSGRLPNRGTTGEVQGHLLVRFDADNAPAGTQQIFELRCTGATKSARVAYQPANSGQISLRIVDDNGTEIANSGYLITGINDQPLLVSFALIEFDADITWALETVNVDTGALVQHTGTFTGTDFGRPWKVIVNTDGGLVDTLVGHCIVTRAYSALAGNGAGARLAEVAQAFRGELASARLFRLATENDLTFAVDQEPSVPSTPMGAQLPHTVLTLLQECVDADLGMLFERRDSLGYRYRERAWFYNLAAAVTLDHSAGEFKDPPVPVDDDQLIVNDVIVSRVDGSEYDARREVGPRGTDAVGVYEASPQVNYRDDGQLPPAAGWRLNVGTVDAPRWPSVLVWLERAVVDTAARAALLGLELGDLLSIENLPDWLPPDDVTVMVVGYSETISNFHHALEFNCRPAEPFTVAEVDGAASRWGASNTTVAVALDSTATTLDVDSGDGPYWTTEASDLPFDIFVGGERMTATAVGAELVGLQALTVTRSVNGVVKSHAVGADVVLADQVRYAW